MLNKSQVQEHLLSIKNNKNNSKLKVEVKMEDLIRRRKLEHEGEKKEGFFFSTSEEETLTGK